MDTISIFEELAKIPSPSLYEENVAKKIMEYTYNNGINAYFDDYKNVIIKVYFFLKSLIKYFII